MDYYTQIQKGIDFIESNLQSELTTADVSSVCGYSIPHLYRVFKGMTGCTVMEYVRKRRLSEACIELMTSESSILGIAMDYGYDSHEAFTRAFKVEYSASPSELRLKPSSKNESNDEITLFEKINLLSNRIEGELIMTPDIVYKEKMTLICAKRFVTGSVEKKFELFRETRDELLSHLNQIENRIGSKFIATYDFNNDDILKPHEDIEYTYYYGVEVQSAIKALDSMAVKEIEAAKYAVFTYDRTAKTLNGETIDSTIYDYINGVWLPNSGYCLSDSEDLEIIDNEKNTVQYLISVLDN